MSRKKDIEEAVGSVIRPAGVGGSVSEYQIAERAYDLGRLAQAKQDEPYISSLTVIMRTNRLIVRLEKRVGRSK